MKGKSRLSEVSGMLGRMGLFSIICPLEDRNFCSENDEFPNSLICALFLSFHQQALNKSFCHLGCKSAQRSRASPSVMNYVFTSHCITVFFTLQSYPLRRSGELPAATPDTDLAIDDDCISEISGSFEEKSENVLYQYKDALINYCIWKAGVCVPFFVLSSIWQIL